MPHSRLISTCLILLAGLLVLQAARAADIAHEVRQGDTESSLALELGLHFGYFKVPLVGFASDDAEDSTEGMFSLGPVLQGRAEWRGLFAELFRESYNGVALGYEAWADEYNAIDLVLTNNLTDYDPGIGEFSSLQLRKGDVIAGLRSTHFFDRSIVQLELYGEATSRHKGYVAAAHLGRFWQIRNWNLHAVSGLRYLSGQVLDYYFGVSNSEASAGIPVYKASGGTLVSLEFGSTLPLTEKWVFRGTARGHYLPDAIADSPLADGRLVTEISTSISYVF